MVTTNEIKNFLKIQETDPVHDDYFDKLIEAATSTIESWCNQPIVIADTTYYFREETSNEKYLPYSKINSISSLLYREKPLESWATVDSTEYELFQMNENYFLYKENDFPYIYKANLSVGYQTIPEDIKQVCIELIAEFYKFSDNSDGRLGIGQIAESVEHGGSVTTTYISNNKRWMDILKKYRILKI